ncbi:hypothetical protein [Plesiomonas sp.]|uniref:hypothetical protein n=1 Tax=Plesiomonas sp. TaxID=2486279 RepID=UPI003F418BEF
MKKYLTSIFLLFSSLVNASSGFVELHPPVKASYQGKEAIVSFLASEGTSSGVIYVISLPSQKSKTINIPNLAKGEVVSVFFYERKNINVKDSEKSMFVLNEEKVDNETQVGKIYSAARFSLFPQPSGLIVQFFERENQDYRFLNCFDGTYKSDNKKSSCEYKDANSIKKALNK